MTIAIPDVAFYFPKCFQFFSETIPLSSEIGQILAFKLTLKYAPGQSHPKQINSKEGSHYETSKHSNRNPQQCKQASGQILSRYGLDRDLAEG